jgi:hypothetical protein
LQIETASSKRTLLLVEKDLAPAETTWCDLHGARESRAADDRVELSGLRSSEVLAALFDRQLKGIVR